MATSSRDGERRLRRGLRTGVIAAWGAPLGWGSSFPGAHEETHDPLHREQPELSHPQVLPQGGLGGPDRPRAAAQADPLSAADRRRGRPLDLERDQGAGPRPLHRHHLHRGDDLRGARPHRLHPRPRTQRGEQRRRGRVPPRGGRRRVPGLHRPRRERGPALPEGHPARRRGGHEGCDGGDGPPLRPQPAQAPGGVSMRILVLGASGYVGSRVVPALLEAGHEVVAASSSTPDPDRFGWGHEVPWVRCDVTDPEAVRSALSDVDGICYLVHSLNVRGFVDRDRVGAQVVRDAVRDSGVRRVVYLSGLVPDVPSDELSAHISSRLEVEQVLSEAESDRCSVVALRAGVVIGAGSTSFEVIRQLSTLLLVQPVPSWLENRVQPIAISDVLRAMCESFADDHLTGAVDIGGPNVLPYSRLLAECARAAGLLRVRVPTLPVPAPLVSLGAAALVAAPFWTVNALIESLRHEMVCRPGETWVPKDGLPLLGVREAMARSFGEPGSGPEAPQPSDPDWTRMRAPVLDELHAPATVRAGASLALRRVRALRGLL